MGIYDLSDKRIQDSYYKDVFYNIRRTNWQSENFNRNRNLNKYQTEIMELNKITEMKKFTGVQQQIQQ